MRTKISFAILVLIIVSLISYWSYIFFLYLQNKSNNKLDCQSTGNQIKEMGERYNGEESVYKIEYGKVYVKDYRGSTRYYDLEPTNIDVDSFHVMSSLYARDNNYIYYYGRRIKNAGYCSFEVSIFENGAGMSEGYARDAKHVYNGGKIMEGADAATFERVNGFYFKDKNHIYHRSGEIVDKIDPNAFY